MSSLASALAVAPVTLDGGLAAELEARGHDVSSALWSARVLKDDPDAVVDVHRAYLAAGARVLTTASYQATFEGFARAGVDLDDARRLMRVVGRAGPGGRRPARAGSRLRRPVRRDARRRVGVHRRLRRPAGRRRAPRTFHRPRLAALADAEPDVLACETVPALAEAEALVEEPDARVPRLALADHRDDADGDVRTRRDEPAAEAFAMARDVDAVVAVGVNCIDPQGAEAAVRLAAEVSRKPVVVYPNSGELWDAGTRPWYGEPVDVAGEVPAGPGRGPASSAAAAASAPPTSPRSPPLSRPRCRVPPRARERWGAPGSFY